VKVAVCISVCVVVLFLSFIGRSNGRGSFS